VTTAAETAQATTAILESGAIMLGAALVFVTLFRRLKLGATLGYIVAGALIGPQLLRLIKDPQQVASVTEIGIALYPLDDRLCRITCQWHRRLVSLAPAFAPAA